MPSVCKWSLLFEKCSVWVSSVAWSHLEEFRSHYSVLTTSKIWNVLKKWQLFVDLSEKWGHKANCCLKNWGEGQAGYRESQVTRTDAHQQKTVGTRIGVGRPILYLMNYWRLSGNKLWELKTPGEPSHIGTLICSWVLPTRAVSDSHSEDGRKTPLCFRQGRD